MRSDSAISLQKVSKRYGGAGRWGNTLREELGYQWARLTGKAAAPAPEVWALREIDLEVPQGCILGLIGHNGAGKSTLLKILAGVTSPTSGKVMLRGRRTSILEIGTGFHPDLTGRANVFLAGAVAGLSEKLIRQRFDAIVDFSGISEFIDMPVKHYSSGMYLRLAFSVAFFTQSDILLLDEVLSVGDLEFRNRSADRVKEIAASGATILLASHELQALGDLCTQALVLDHGRIQHFGRPKEVLEQYLGAFYDRYHRSTEEGGVHSEGVDFVDVEVQAVGKAIAEPLRHDAVEAGGKSILELIRHDDAIQFTIRYRKLRDEGDLDIVLSISDYKTMLLSDCPIYREEYVQVDQKAGSYTAIVTLPGHLLNEGTYYVHLIFGDKLNALLTLNYVKKFQVASAKWEEGKKWNEGMVKPPLRPRLEWQVQATTLE
jgi:lipopolysaccharide transport system ATP-binding protein